MKNLSLSGMPKRVERTASKKGKKQLRVLLLADTDGATVAAGGLCVLTTDTEAPRVTETAVETHLLHALEVLTHLALDGVGDELRVRAVDDVLLAVEHPDGDLKLEGLLHDRDDLLDLLGLELTRTTIDVDVSLLAEEGGETAADTLDAAEGVDDLLTAVKVSVAHTKDVGERRVSNKRHC